MITFSPAYQTCNKLKNVNHFMDTNLIIVLKHHGVIYEPS